MKKRNTLLTVALLLAVIVLGVGYAAYTGPWVVTGTATAKGSELEVKFTASEGSTDDSEDGNVETKFTDTTGTMTVELADIGDTATATFTLTNNSKAGIGAEIAEDQIVLTRGANSEYFDVTYELASNTIKSDGGITTLTVTVKLLKATPVDKTETFEVSINEITAVAE